MDFKEKYQVLEKFLKSNKVRCLELKGLRGASRTWLLSRYLDSFNGPLLWITKDSKEAEDILTDFSFFTNEQVSLYPGHESLPFVPVMPSSEIIAQKISILYALSTLQKPLVIVAPVQAIFELTLPPSVLLKNVEYIQKGEEANREKLLPWLINTGYRHSVLVQTRGEFSIRGEVIDLFPPGHNYPVRIDFFGDMVESIRYFDPSSQRSKQELEELEILPASELLYFDDLVDKSQENLIEKAEESGWPSKRINEVLHRLENKRLAEEQYAMMPLFYKPSSLFEYLPQNVLVVLDDMDSIQKENKAYWEHAEGLYNTAVREYRVLHPISSILLEPDSFQNEIRTRPAIYMNKLSMDMASLPFHKPTAELDVIEFYVKKPEIPLLLSPLKKADDLLKPFFLKLKEWLHEEKKIVIVVPGMRHAQRMLKLLNEHEIYDVTIENNVSLILNLNAWKGTLLKIFIGALSEGFFLSEENFMIVNEDELLGKTSVRARAPKKSQISVSDITFEDLKPGGYVVHNDHGIGLYHGLVKMDVEGITGEFLHLEYRGGDKLYLPVDRLGLIQKYVGIEGREPILDRLGGSTFTLKKQKARKAVYEIAHELVDLYAERQVSEGFSFSPPRAIFREFEAAFPYEETPDQANAIDEIISDMKRTRPMDRLLCGDVGYGKTEVVMRAAFKAVLDEKQVAVLVPTTLLAEQHERTFKKRFANFPINIGAISRLKTRKEQKEIINGIKLGTIDIAIGTHRLLQADVQFKDVGLLIIDEEHRFGVRQKERLKHLKHNIDCLSLTATPIPRTLQLSMLGLRDLSVINTPPKDRMPIKTFISEFDDILIKEAITRELKRGGQLFFVNNRIKGIHRLCEHLKKLVPEGRFEVAHGQMEPSTLEDIMIRFVRGEIDCLVCTTIIEAGIDIPSANTIIINRADRLGIADLYQLRGRVGRAGEQAYAFLLVLNINQMNQDAMKRLQAVMEMSLSGGGLRLAMQDLQLRGAGNILGIAQSGNIAEVGYELFLDLLKDAVDEINGQPMKKTFDPEVNLDIPAYIPDEYVTDVEQRLLLYRRIARLENEVEAEDLKQELIDRFGKLPLQIFSLFDLMSIKRILRSMNCIRLNMANSKDGSSKLFFTFALEEPISPDTVIKLIQKNKSIQFLPDGRLVMRLKSSSLPQVTEACNYIQKWLKRS